VIEDKFVDLYARNFTAALDSPFPGKVAHRIAISVVTGPR
jgi:hypothetical protein